MTLLDQMNKSDIKENIKYEPYSFVEWQERKRIEKAKMAEMSSKIAVQCTEDHEILKNVLDLMAKFPQYSAGNIMLIQAQRPDAAYLADYSFWKDKGMFIREGEQGISVFALKGEYTKKDGTTGYNYAVKKIFDISQIQNQSMEKEADKDINDILGALIRSSPCPIQLERNDCDEHLTARYRYSDKEITINRAGTPEEIFREMTREISLVFLGGFSSQEYQREGLEFAAQCASYVLCRRYAVVPDPEFLRALPEEFTRYSEKNVKSFLTRVRYASAVITNEMEKYLISSKEKEIDAV